MKDSLFDAILDLGIDDSTLRWTDNPEEVRRIFAVNLGEKSKDIIVFTKDDASHTDLALKAML